MAGGGGGGMEELLGSKKAIGNGPLEMSNATADSERGKSGRAGLGQPWEILMFRNTMVTTRK